jgi:predicted nuclease of predicted toxin-antitoxin system
VRLLLDMPVSPRLETWLATLGHDAVHALSLGLDRASDEELLALARAEGRTVVTADTDFPQLLALSGQSSPGVILFRGGSYSRAEMQGLLSRVLTAFPEATLAASVCVVDRRSIRCRALPLLG